MCDGFAALDLRPYTLVKRALDPEKEKKEGVSGAPCTPYGDRRGGMTAPTPRNADQSTTA